MYRTDADIDNRELERVKRTAKQEAEWEERAQAQEREAATKHHMDKKEYDAERAKRLAKDSYMESNELLKVRFGGVGCVVGALTTWVEPHWRASLPFLRTPLAPSHHAPTPPYYVPGEKETETRAGVRGAATCD